MSEQATKRPTFTVAHPVIWRVTCDLCGTTIDAESQLQSIRWQRAHVNYHVDHTKERR